MGFENEFAGELKQGRSRRPGCVTVYALWLWLIGVVILGLGGLTSVSIFTALAEVSEAEVPEVVIAASLVICFCGFIAFIPLVTGLGIWRMSMWGWMGIMLSHVLFLLFSSCSLFGNIMIMMEERPGSNGLTTIGMLLLFIVVGMGITIWFWRKRALFAVGVAKWEVDSEDTNAAGDRIMTILLIVGGGAAVLVFLSIFVIAMLTLLGPQIGTVFSSIVETLE
ncbi:MAG TPA: hypothetical protein VLL52_13610 [Anaerolineae bacterium]|nr:hypothetical protein [Anaerolineae bacterium]